MTEMGPPRERRSENVELRCPLKPPFAYFGGKTVLADRIVALLPDHAHYVEPFAGSLAVLLAKTPSKLETVNDLDGDLMLFWRMLRDRPDELIRAAALTPHSRAEHQAAYEIDGDEVERARRVWTRLAQGRTGTLRKTGWRYFQKPAGTGNAMPQYLDAYVERMEQVAIRLRSVSLECRPALEIISSYGQHPAVCLYVDPPYEGVTRPRTYDGYQHEMRATNDHLELLQALLDCQASVVLSGYHSPLYDDVLDTWDRVEISAFTGQAPAGEGARTEVLWSNRPLHDGRLDLYSVAASGRRPSDGE
jgi:DNA adenine methylase